jgi:hypothetical protein
MVFVKVSETYDLSTKVGKIGIVGIHTPRGSLFTRMWGGLIGQHKKFRFASCDITMACASMLPADPLQIGVEAGAIAPQDMFNPILYKAVSNESMNRIVQFMYAQYKSQPLGQSTLRKGSVIDINDVDKFGDTESPADQLKMYYSLLADDDGWRKAMPQAGLQMKGLYPLVYQMVNAYGFPYANTSATEIDNSIGAYDNQITLPNGSGNDAAVYSKDTTPFKGPSMRMPWMPTKVLATTVRNYVAANGPASSGGLIEDTMEQIVGQFPPCYVACMVLPPATLNQLYYRLKVTWTIELADLIPLTATMNWNDMASVGALAYGTDYALQSEATAKTASLDLVDTTGADATKVMEGI